MRLSDIRPCSMMEDLVDMEEVSEENVNKSKWLIGFKEAQRRMHRIVRAVESKKKFNCINVWYEELVRQSAGGV